MRGNIPLPGSTRATLLDVGLRMFGTMGYDAVEVDAVAADAGVTVGALYHHFRSKQRFYGVLRDEMTQRLLDRMEAAVDATPPERRLQGAVLAAYDGLLRIKAGKLLTEPDPRGHIDALAAFLTDVAAQGQRGEADILGAILAAAIRAAFIQGSDNAERQGRARAALQDLVE